MSNCEFIMRQNHSPVILTGNTPVVQDGEFYDVQINEFIKHNGVNSKVTGLVTSGAGPCLVLVAHHKMTNTGCMAHINTALDSDNSHRYASCVIEKMIVSLTGKTDSKDVQIFFFEGNSFHKDFWKSNDLYAWLNDSILYYYTCLGIGNYVYIPKLAQIFAIRDRFNSLPTQQKVGQKDFLSINGVVQNEFSVDLKELHNAAVYSK